MVDKGNCDWEWRDGHPFAPAYGDYYYATKDPLGESRYCFLQGNDLPARWVGTNHFTIAETGFGTGLNLLTVLDHFVEHPWQSLTYVSWEKHPIPLDGLREIHRQWPSLAEAADALQEVYPRRFEGVCRMHLMGGVHLILVKGDVNDGLTGLDQPADAWFLDGFAPRVNEDMWHEGLLREIYTQTAVGGTVATYTAASAVRRAMQTAGFRVVRKPGFGGKREMLTGVRD